MESIELDTSKEHFDLSISVEYDPDEQIPPYFNVSYNEGDVSWLFDELTEALKLAKALERAWDQCFDFNQ